MKRAELSACDVAPSGAAFEPPRRRNITVTPGHGSPVVLSDRARVAVTA